VSGVDGGAGAAGASGNDPNSGGAPALEPESSPPVYGMEADDDDCKYHVAWSATPVCEASNITFQVVVTSKVDGSIVRGADVRAEVFQSTHLAPNSNTKTIEQADGTYSVGPVRFDAAGQWVVRFHLFERCSDELEDSPHGHVAFYVNVP
jgi:hypothetical protein